MAIVGGGAATRFPGKLLADAGGRPLIARVYENVGRGRETWVATAGGLPAWADAFLPVPFAVDRVPGRGPLGGLVTTLAQMRSPWVFVVAGDAPFAGEAVLERLRAACEPGDEAVVPHWMRDGVDQPEPLTALYERLAFLRAGGAALRAGRRSVLAALGGLAARAVAFPDGRPFRSLNTPADYAAARAELDLARVDSDAARAELDA